MATLAEARQAKALAITAYHDHKGIAGIGIARHLGGGYCVKINVNKATDKLPSTINDVPVCIEVIGQCRKQSQSTT